MLVNLEDDIRLLVPFLNGRREGANLSSRVIVLPDLKFLKKFHKLVILF